MPLKKRKDPKAVDVSLTNQHHDCYGEEVDPGLARMLGRAKKATGDSDNKSTSSDKTVDLTTTAIEVVNTTITPDQIYVL